MSKIYSVRFLRELLKRLHILSGCKSLLHEAVEERKRLEGETEQLKQLVRQYDTEIATKDTEMATKNNVIEEYKTICSQLSSKLEKAQKANSGSGTAPPSSLVSTDSGVATNASSFCNIMI